MSIYKIINLYIPLRAHVAQWEANCPFCKDRERSLIVDRKNETWHCFKCGKGGNSERFKELYENKEAMALMGNGVAGKS